MKKRMIKACVTIGLACIVGCETWDVDPTAHMDFKTRSVVAAMEDEEISVDGAESMAAMKKERKLQIAVATDVSYQFRGQRGGVDAGAFVDEAKIKTSAQAFARSRLVSMKGFRLEAISLADLNRALKSGDDINGITFPFLCNVKMILTSEAVNSGGDFLQVYKCVLQWELIDNRTKINGLGENPTPVVVESMLCQNVVNKRRPTSVSGAAVWGDEESSAQLAYNDAIGNCLAQFYTQLANRVPFGGVVSGMKIRDDSFYVNLKADARGQGVVKRMQMLLMNEDGDRIAVGEVLTSANGTSNIKIWRWLSKSYRKELESVAAKGKDAAEEWLDENPLYALCLGLPEPPKDMMLDHRSRK